MKLAALIPIVLIAGCASMNPEIRVQSTAADLARLTGTWSGEYRHSDSGKRRGTILFNLVGGEDHAHGNVTMTFPQIDRTSEGRQLKVTEGRLPSRVLSIRFVLARAGFVEGALEPYWDPDTQAETWTTFHGEIKGNRIEGWFVSRTATSPDQTNGTWRVYKTRERAK